MEKMTGMKRMREDGGIRGIGREEVIEDMEVVLVAEEVVLVAAADFATKDHPPKS